jgi:hypothetical protein
MILNDDEEEAELNESEEGELGIPLDTTEGLSDND